LLSGSGSKAAKSATHSSKSDASNAANFGGVLSGAMANSSTDPSTQLAALINNGTPISTIVDQLSNQIADAIQQQFPATQLGSGASRTKLVNSIKSALSPPANAPPGTAANQVAALEQRLQRWLEGLSRGADQQVGQQSDISGKILDANSARETPAQTQGSKSTSVATGLVCLAHSLLKSVAASLTGGAASTAPSQSTAKLPAHLTPKPEIGSSHLLAPARAAIAAASSAAAATKSDVPAGTLATDPSAANAPGSSTAIAPDPSSANAQPPVAASNAVATSTAQTPGDLVARMVARAAGVDAQHNADLPTVASAAPAAQLVRGTGETSTSTLSPDAMAAKMTMLLTDAINAASAGTDQRGAAQDDALQDQDANAASSSAPLKTAARTDLSSFSLPTAPSPMTATQAQTQAAAADPAPVDPTVAIEQLVKSMAMRTGSDGTSEMRLRLQPESLGSVTLKLSVDGNNVSANVVAQSGEARTALLAGQHHLARSLADSGLKLTSFTVDLSGGQSQDQRDPTSGFGRKYTVHEGAVAETDSTESPSDGPALLPGSTLGLLSYLA
jgi:flagellar hook-length control protein FliK